MDSADSVLVMQMGSSGETRHAHEANRLPLPYSTADPRLGEAGHVSIECRDVAAVLQDDCVSVPVSDAAKRDLPVASGFYRCARGGCIVNAPVGPNGVQYRVSAVGFEVGAVTCEILWRSY